jgi:tetratricopeptide (TPR) repeat protein
MKLRVIMGLLAGCIIAAAEEIRSVEEAIPSSVKALAAPSITDFPQGIQMAVTAATDQAQTHVNQGINHLHGAWEFQASRHFAAAMREDPECLLAHWGMLMTLLSPSPETVEARAAATERLLHLINKGNGSELERGYAYGIVKFLEDGPQGAANAYRIISEKFPNDLQSPIFAALFGRDGYDELGFPRAGQETAEKNLLALTKKHPLSPVPLNALLSIRAEAPDLVNSMDLARKLHEISPNYPPHAHLVGHFQWRCGDHKNALKSFTDATEAFTEWMKSQSVSAADCPEWLKSECYRIVALNSVGKAEAAIQAAKEIAQTPYPKDRSDSPGARLIFWDAETLVARLLLHRGLPGDASDALAFMGKPLTLKAERKNSLAHWWSDGLRIVLETQRLIESNELTKAREALNALAFHGENMAKTQQAASAAGERSAWNRAFRALETLAGSLRGRIVLLGPQDRIGTAYNWFAAAADSQGHAPLMFPPMVLTPMPIHLGEFFLAQNQPNDAIAAYERALTAFPNDHQALRGLEKAFLSAKLPEKAEATRKTLDRLLAP